MCWGHSFRYFRDAYSRRGGTVAAVRETTRGAEEGAGGGRARLRDGARHLRRLVVQSPPGHLVR